MLCREVTDDPPDRKLIERYRSISLSLNNWTVVRPSSNVGVGHGVDNVVGGLPE